jgi:hypothetical protein
LQRTTLMLGVALPGPPPKQPPRPFVAKTTSVSIIENRVTLSPTAMKRKQPTLVSTKETHLRTPRAGEVIPHFADREVIDNTYALPQYNSTTIYSCNTFRLQEHRLKLTWETVTCRLSTSYGPWNRAL